MTLQELYLKIDGDYEQALKVMRIDKLIDKHIRKFPSSTIFASLQEAQKNNDPNGIFESTHAIKGVCANLGLTKLAHISAEVCDDFRVGNTRKYSDDDINEMISKIIEMFNTTSYFIHQYENDI